MLCGALPAIGGIRPADRFEFSLTDPIHKPVISHGYDIAVPPFHAETLDEPHD